MKQRTWESIWVGEQLPPLTDALTFTRVASAPAATLDWYPLHHDPEFAQRQGQPGIVMSTVQLMGLVDRAVTDWAGPETFIRRREMQLQQSVFAHDVVRCRGQVSRKDPEPVGDEARRSVSIDLEVINERDVRCCRASVTVVVPTERMSRGQA